MTGLYHTTNTVFRRKVKTGTQRRWKRRARRGDGGLRNYEVKFFRRVGRRNDFALDLRTCSICRWVITTGGTGWGTLRNSSDNLWNGDRLCSNTTDHFTDPENTLLLNCKIEIFLCKDQCFRRLETEHHLAAEDVTRILQMKHGLTPDTVCYCAAMSGVRNLKLIVRFRRRVFFDDWACLILSWIQWISNDTSLTTKYDEQAREMAIPVEISKIGFRIRQNNHTSINLPILLRKSGNIPFGN